MKTNLKFFLQCIIQIIVKQIQHEPNYTFRLPNIFIVYILMELRILSELSHSYGYSFKTVLLASSLFSSRILLFLWFMQSLMVNRFCWNLNVTKMNMQLSWDKTILKIWFSYVDYFIYIRYIIKFRYIYILLNKRSSIAIHGLQIMVFVVSNTVRES